MAKSFCQVRDNRQIINQGCGKALLSAVVITLPPPIFDLVRDEMRSFSQDRAPIFESDSFSIHGMRIVRAV